MKRTWLGALLVVVLATAAWAQPLTFPLSDIHPGLRGYALSEGPRGIERIDIEFLGLQEGFGLPFPLVLVQASGRLIDLGGGVAAGMSGSPVYASTEAGDAVVGAIAYVFSGARGGLAMVTPIEAMRAGRVSAISPSALQQVGLEPVATPLLVRGVGERALALLTGMVGERGFAVQAIPSLGGGGGREDPWQPGSAIAVAWALGDIDITAVGTLTELHDGSLLAFGHPVLGIGAVDWPLVDAEITAIVPQQSVPFKLANTGSSVRGRVLEDATAALRGRTASVADTIPVTLTLAWGTRPTLRFEVVRDELLWPLLVAVATFEAIDRERGRTGQGTATVHWDIGFRDGPGLRMSEKVVHPDDVALASARLVAAPLLLLTDNPFQRAEVSSLSLLVELDDRRRDIEVMQLVDQGTVPVPGELAGFFMRLQPWRMPGEVRPLDIAWPEDLTGEIELVVRGATEPRSPDDSRAPRPLELPLSFDELLAFLRDRARGGDLVVEARSNGGEWRRLDRFSVGGFVTGQASLSFFVPEPEEAASEVNNP